MVVGVAVGVPLSLRNQSGPTDPNLQAVRRILKEVPLIDGYVIFMYTMQKDRVYQGFIKEYYIKYQNCNVGKSSPSCFGMRLPSRKKPKLTENEEKYRKY